MKQYIAFSGGKDSTAMLLRMIELGEQIDGVFFADTGEEWDLLHEYIKNIEKLTGLTIEVIQPKYSLWDGMDHINVKGKSKGEYRGFPLAFDPCYFMRDSKFLPQQERTKDGIVCIGYASDEPDRGKVAKEKGLIRCPLQEWGWTENMCADYLNRKSLLNPLYTNFNRLGCIPCPKQGMASLYVIWKMHPDKWEYIRKFNTKQNKLRGEDILFVDGTFSMIERKFKAGFVPKKRPKYACVDCKGVSKLWEDQECLFSFT